MRRSERRDTNALPCQSHTHPFLSILYSSIYLTFQHNPVQVDTEHPSLVPSISTRRRQDHTRQDRTGQASAGTSSATRALFDLLGGGQQTEWHHTSTASTLSR